MTQRSSVDKTIAPDVGIVTNVAKDAIPPRGWSGGLNCQFRDGYARTSPGWEKFTQDSFGVPVAGGEQFFLLDGTSYLIAVTTTGIFYLDTTPEEPQWVDISGTALTGLIEDYVSIDTWPNQFIITNNKDRIRKWEASGNTSNLGGLTTADGVSGTVDVSAAKSLVTFAGFVHLLNTVEDAERLPQRWRWSAFNDSETWDNTGTYGQAGYADITDGPDVGMAIKRLGNDYVAIYKEHSIHIAQYVGPPTVFARRLVISNVGLRATGAVADLGDEHIFLGDDNFYVFNGLAIKAIGTPIFQTFLDELNPEKASLVKAYVIDEENEVWFIYPTSGSDTPNKMVCYNYINGAWSFRDAPFTCLFKWRESVNTSWDAMVGTWEDHPEQWDSRIWTANNPVILAGQNDGYVQKIGQDIWGQDGSNHDSYVITPALDAGRPDIIKRWLRIFIDAVKVNNYDLEVSFAGVNHLHDDQTFGTARNFDMGLGDKPWVDIDTSCRWLFIKFRTNHTERPWQISGYGTERVERGRY